MEPIDILIDGSIALFAMSYFDTLIKAACSAYIRCMTIETEIVVAGTGPAGLMAALALSQAGFTVGLAGPEANRSDRRTTALMKPQLDFLERLGVLDAIQTDAAPLKVMRIADGTQRLLRSSVVTFRAAEIGEEMFGLNMPNRHLVAVLDEQVAATPTIVRVPALVRAWSLEAAQVRAELDDGSTALAKLAVAADGRNSPAREAAGITLRSHSTGQSALVLNFAHGRSHEYTSTEFHTEHGPFTQVPLPGQRSSLVWVTRPEHAAELVELDDAELSRIIEERMQSMLGRVEVEPGHQVFPLASALPSRFASNRVALVGEAAHVFPPIGAQGLNLSIRDIESLCAVGTANATDPGAPEALAAFDRARRPDILARSSAVNLLNRSLLSDQPTTQLARVAGLNLLGSVPFLRNIFMREGLRTGSGFGSFLRS